MVQRLRSVEFGSPMCRTSMRLSSCPDARPGERAGAQRREWDELPPAESRVSRTRVL